MFLEGSIMVTEGTDRWMDAHLVAKKRQMGGSGEGKRVGEEKEYEKPASVLVKETHLFLVGVINSILEDCHTQAAHWVLPTMSKGRIGVGKGWVPDPMTSAPQESAASPPRASLPGPTDA